MTLIHDAAVHILLADYIATDAAGKLNLIGGGITFLGDQGNGVSAPFSVAAQVSVPEKYVGQRYALTLELHDITVGSVVTMPTPPSGAPEALRAQQVVTVAPVILPPHLAKPDDIMVTHTMAMQFSNGLPLPVGHSYEFRVQIDGDHRKDWFVRFHRPSANGVIIGGPAGPSNIPGVADYVVRPPERDDPNEQEPPGQGS